MPPVDLRLAEEADVVVVILRDAGGRGGAREHGQQERCAQDDRPGCVASMSSLISLGPLRSMGPPEMAASSHRPLVIPCPVHRCRCPDAPENRLRPPGPVGGGGRLRAASPDGGDLREGRGPWGQAGHDPPDAGGRCSRLVRGVRLRAILLNLGRSSFRGSRQDDER